MKLAKIIILFCSWNMAQSDEVQSLLPACSALLFQAADEESARNCCVDDQGRRVSSPADVCNVETNGNSRFPILLASVVAGCVSHDE
jgi:hypothetical protein